MLGGKGGTFVCVLLTSGQDVDSVLIALILCSRMPGERPHHRTHIINAHLENVFSSLEIVLPTKGVFLPLGGDFLESKKNWAPFSGWWVTDNGYAS